MNLDVTVRRVFPDDWELFARVRLAALRESPSAYASRYEDWAQATPERWRQRLTDVPANWVAQRGAEPSAEPVGLIGGRVPEPGGYAELIAMWVSPTVRGQGVGDDLVRRMLAWAGRQPGVGRVELGVFEGNRAAQTLYQRNGFWFAGPETGDPGSERRMALLF